MTPLGPPPEGLPSVPIRLRRVLDDRNDLPRSSSTLPTPTFHDHPRPSPTFRSRRHVSRNDKIFEVTCPSPTGPSLSRSLLSHDSVARRGHPPSGVVNRRGHKCSHPRRRSGVLRESGRTDRGGCVGPRTRSPGEGSGEDGGSKSRRR